MFRAYVDTVEYGDDTVYRLAKSSGTFIDLSS